MTTKKTILLGFLILLLALFFTGLATIAMLGRDDPSVNDADLQLTRLKIPDDQNAWSYIEKAARAFDPTYDDQQKFMERATTNPARLKQPPMPSKTKPSDAMTNKVKALLKSHDWQPERAKNVLEENQTLLAYFDKALTCPHSQIPEITYSNHQFDITSPLRYLGQLNTLRAATLFKAGQEKEALDETIKTLRFGRQIQNSGGTLLHFLAGSNIEAMGLKQLQDFLRDTSLPSKILTPYIAELKEYRVTANSWSNTMKQEYHLFAESIELIAEGKPTGNAGPTTFLKPKTFLPHLFLPNNSKNLFSDIYRTMIENGSKPYCEHKPLTSYRYQGVIRTFLSRNGGGKLIGGILIPSLENTLPTKCNENNLVAATRCLIALKCHQLDHGDLPASLSELVPTYLDAVPLDDYDNTPLRYNRDQKILYSVGQDLIDNGGTINPQKRHQEIAYKIEF